jgi:hypothetical protein
MKRGEKIIFILISIFIIISTTHLASAADILVWQGQYFNGTTFNTGTYEFNFSVYDALTGGEICYSNATNLTTGNFGEWITEQAGVGSACNNTSKEYFLNINIDRTDQSPRRRLTMWNYLRKDVDEITTGKLQIDNQVIAPIVQANAQIIAPIVNSNYITADQVNITNNADIFGVLRTNSPLKIKQSMQYVNLNDEVIYDSFVQGQNEIMPDIPEIFNNSLIYLKIKSLINPDGYRVVYFDNITKQSLFTLSRNVNGRASTIFNLMVIPENRTIDSSFNLCQGNYIDCASNEPDLWVYDDIESGGSIFSNENVTAHYFIGDGSRLTGISAGGNLFDQHLNTTSNVSFNRLNITTSLFVEKNITSLGTGFFSYLGNSVNRINKSWIKDINFNGIINGTGNITTNGKISTTDSIQGNYYSADGSQGMTDTTHLYACIGEKCEETCSLQIKNGLIVDCKT